MYIPAPFVETRLDVLHDLIQRHPFATLVSTSHVGTPVISHVPLLLDGSRGDSGTLIGHLARTNPHAAELSSGRPSVAIFHGPHAYISPEWYRSAPSVPTWNYAVVHSWGTARIIADPVGVYEILKRTVTAFEAPDSTWNMDALPPAFLKAMSEAVVAFEIPIERLQGKFKLSQNRSLVDQANVFQALSRGNEASKSAANAMPVSASLTPDPT